jgi:DnaK suppressor protein
MSQVDSIDTSAAEAMAARVANSIERGERQLRELESSLVGALTDHDTIQEDQNSLRALVEAIRFDVTQARRAQVRIADGTYGLCCICRTPISPDRLDAMPSTERCSRCA